MRRKQNFKPDFWTKLISFLKVRFLFQNPLAIIDESDEEKEYAV